MNIIVFAILVIIVVAMLVYACDLITFFTEPFKGLVKALIVVMGALLILNRAGVLT